MSTPQQPRTRRRQKVRRTKQLVAWRVKNADKAEAPASAATPATTPAK